MLHRSRDARQLLLSGLQVSLQTFPGDKRLNLTFAKARAKVEGVRKGFCGDVEQSTEPL